MTTFVTACVLQLCAQVCVASPAAVAGQQAGYALVNAKVWTGDTAQPWAQALVVNGGQLAYVGSDADARRMQPAHVIDARGRLIVPGFIDSHIHFLDGGSSLTSVQLHDVRSRVEFVARIKQFAATVPPGTWITGGNWDHTLWGGELPTREWIDAVTPGHPVWVSRIDGHIGPRIRTTYAFRTLIDDGARLAFGSDWSVAPATPLEGIYAAVTRRTLDDKNPGGWVPEQKISVEEALRAYTANAAYASFEESAKGTLAAGKLADFVVLDRDLLNIPPPDLRNAKVIATVVGGRAVFGNVEGPQ